jgi:hypothetical protein
LRDNGLTRKKAEALYSVYKRGLKEGRFDSMFGAASWCARQPAPCFFISSKSASLLVGKMIAGSTLSECHESQRRMVRQLYADYLRFLEENPGTSLSRERIMELLVDRPAPEFYISTDGARKMLRGEMKRRRRRLGWYD